MLDSNAFAIGPKRFDMPDSTPGRISSPCILHDVDLPGPGPAPQRTRNRLDMLRFIDERELRSSLTEQFRNRFSDPAGRSGYEDDLAREVEDARKFKRALVR
jgi:hypothetical protein